LVYEDQNLNYTASNNQMTQAEADMNYIQNNYFVDLSYETVNGKPLLLDFGPFGPIQSAPSWNTILGTLSTPPAFITMKEVHLKEVQMLLVSLHGFSKVI